MKRLLACLIVFGFTLYLTASPVEANYPPCIQVCCEGGTAETPCSASGGSGTCWMWWWSIIGAGEACP